MAVESVWGASAKPSRVVARSSVTAGSAITDQMSGPWVGWNSGPMSEKNGSKASGGMPLRIVTPKVLSWRNHDASRSGPCGPA